MLKLGELIFRPDPETPPKLPVKLATIPKPETNSVPGTVVDTSQPVEPPLVRNEPPQPLEQRPELPVPPVIDESAITVDVDDSNVHPHVDSQGAQHSSVPDLWPDVVPLI